MSRFFPDFDEMLKYCSMATEPTLYAMYRAHWVSDWWLGSRGLILVGSFIVLNLCGDLDS